MIGDDLVPLLSQGPGPGLRFRQGQVVAWNAATGANTIDVAGAQLVNVPILNTGEAIALKAGHVVGLLAWQSSYWILGRITVPGAADFAAASVAFGSAGAQASNFTIPATLTLRASATLAVPSWADEAIIHVTGTGTFVNRTTGPLLGAMSVGVNGGHGGGAFQGFAADLDAGFQQQQVVSASSRNHFTGLIGGSTLTVEAKVVGSSSFGVADGNNFIVVHSIAIYKSNV